MTGELKGTMDPNIEQQMLAQLGWLEKRCRKDAGDRWDDVLQDTLERFIRKEAQGWFVQQTRLGLAHQVGDLLGWCLLQAARDHRRAIAKTRGEVIVEDDPFPEPGPGPLEQLEDAQSGVMVRDAVARLQHPVRKLAILCLHFPDDVTQAEVDAAAAYQRNGRRAIQRSGSEVGTLILRERMNRQPGDGKWRRKVAEILRCEGRLGDADPDAVTRAVAVLEGWQTDALRDLARDALLTGLRAEL